VSPPKDWLLPSADTIAICYYYHKLQLKPKTIDELKVAPQNIWEELSQGHMNKAHVVNFINCLTACVAAKGGQWSLGASAVPVRLHACVAAKGGQWSLRASAVTVRLHVCVAAKGGQWSLRASAVTVRLHVCILISLTTNRPRSVANKLPGKTML